MYNSFLIYCHYSTLPLYRPFGQSILPMIENMFGQSQLRPTAPAAVAPIQPSEDIQRLLQGDGPTADTAGLLQGLSAAAMSAAPMQRQAIQSVQSAQQMEQFVSEYKAVVVMFTSPTCGPCQMIKPKFKELVEEKNGQSNSIKVLGVLLDLSVAPDAQRYPIRGVPTFYFYLEGKKYSEFSGADYAELKSQLDILLFEAYPRKFFFFFWKEQLKLKIFMIAHPHRRVLLKEIPHQPTVPILYTNVGKLDVIYGKLKEFSGASLSPTEDKTLQESRQFLEKKQSFDVSLWSSLVDNLLDKLSCDQWFPLLDIFKSLLVHEQVSHFYTKHRKFWMCD